MRCAFPGVGMNISLDGTVNWDERTMADFLTSSFGAIEIEPDVVLVSYGGSTGGLRPWSLLRMQRIRIDTQEPGLPPGSAMGGWVRLGCLGA